MQVKYINLELRRLLAKIRLLHNHRAQQRSLLRDYQRAMRVVEPKMLELQCFDWN